MNFKFPASLPSSPNGIVIFDASSCFLNSESSWQILYKAIELNDEEKNYLSYSLDLFMHANASFRSLNYIVTRVFQFHNVCVDTLRKAASLLVPNTPFLELLKKLHSQGNMIVFLSSSAGTLVRLAVPELLDSVDLWFSTELVFDSSNRFIRIEPNPYSFSEEYKGCKGVETGLQLISCKFPEVPLTFVAAGSSAFMMSHKDPSIQIIYYHHNDRFDEEISFKYLTTCKSVDEIKNFIFTNSTFLKQAS